MDPEDTRLLTYYGKPRHRFPSLRSTHAAAGAAPRILLQPMIAAARLVKVQCQVLNR